MFFFLFPPKLCIFEKQSSMETKREIVVRCFTVTDGDNSSGLRFILALPAPPLPVGG
jgi:hypothetical protein